MKALQLLGLWISAGSLIVALWGLLGVQWNRRANDMQRRDFHAHRYAKRLLIGGDRV